MALNRDGQIDDNGSQGVALSSTNSEIHIDLIFIGIMTTLIFYYLHTRFRRNDEIDEEDSASCTTFQPNDFEGKIAKNYSIREMASDTVLTGVEATADEIERAINLVDKTAKRSEQRLKKFVSTHPTVKTIRQTLDSRKAQADASNSNETISTALSFDPKMYRGNVVRGRGRKN